MKCRSVYEQAAQPRRFVERLDLRIKHHDREIERACNHHYQSFVDSIQGLLKVRSDVVALKVRSIDQYREGV